MIEIIPVFLVEQTYNIHLSSVVDLSFRRLGRFGLSNRLDLVCLAPDALRRLASFDCAIFRLEVPHDLVLVLFLDDVDIIHLDVFASESLVESLTDYLNLWRRTFSSLW